SLVESILALGLHGAAVCMFDHEAGVFVVTHPRGLPQTFVEAVHEADSDMPGLVRGSGRTQIVDVASDQDTALVGGGFRSLIASPIWVDGWLAGTLLGASPEPGSISASEEEAFELLAAQAGMAMENAQRFEETLETVEQLQELDKLKDDFMATASHEIRTPLTVILGSGATLEQMWDELDDPTRRGLISGVNRNARTLESLMSSLLDFTRLGGESLGMGRRTIDLGALAGEVASRLGPLFDRRSLQVEAQDDLIV